MPITIRETFDKIFKPPSNGGRQVIALSRANAERLPAVDSAALISITGPNRPPATLAPFNYLLRLTFADVDFDSVDLSSKAIEKLPYQFTEVQATQVLAFVEGLPAGIRSIVVHCEGGFSRSCAVAKALHALYGYAVDDEQLSEANPAVERVLRETAKRRAGVAKKRRK
ncbi:UNVERIFIED_ORG: hypothetical protein DFO49_4417 [Herbaspirillum seropedicae]